MARTFAGEFGRLLKETKDMEGMSNLVAIVLRRTAGRVCPRAETKMWVSARDR